MLFVNVCYLMCEGCYHYGRRIYLSGIIVFNNTVPLNKDKECHFYENKENNIWMLYCYNVNVTCASSSDLKSFSIVSNTPITRPHIENMLQYGDKNINVTNAYVMSGTIVINDVSCPKRKFDGIKYASVAEYCGAINFDKYTVIISNETDTFNVIDELYFMNRTNIHPNGIVSDDFGASKYMIDKDMFQIDTIPLMIKYQGLQPTPDK